MHLLTTLITLAISLDLASGWFRLAIQKELQTSGITFVSREEWGARPPKSTHPMLIPVPFVFIHHTATPAPAPNEDANAASVRSIQDFHMDTRGWDDIGYSFLIGTDGKAYVGRGWERVGAHTQGYNSKGIGIAVIGNYMTVLPNAAQLKAVKDLIQYGLKNGYVEKDYSIYGHRDTKSTSCPGDKLYAEIKRWDHYAYRPLNLNSYRYI